MIKKNTKYGTLRGLAVAGVMGACSVGLCHAAIVINIADDGANVTISSAGGLLDLTGGMSTGEMMDAGPDTLWYGLTIPGFGVTEIGLSAGGDLNLIGYSGLGIAGWTAGDGITAIQWTSPSQYDLLVIDPTGFLYSDTLIASINNIDAFSATTFNPETVAGLGFTAGSSYIVTLDSGDTVTFTITAVPEPSSALLASFGFGLLAFCRKRK